MKLKQKIENYLSLKKFSKSQRNDLDPDLDSDPFFPVRIQDPDPDPLKKFNGS